MLKLSLVVMFTATGLLVRFLKVFEKSGYQSVKWVRYLSKANGSYQIRVSHGLAGYIVALLIACTVLVECVGNLPESECMHICVLLALQSLFCCVPEHRSRCEIPSGRRSAIYVMCVRATQTNIVCLAPHLRHRINPNFRSTLSERASHAAFRFVQYTVLFSSAKDIVCV